LRRRGGPARLKLKPLPPPMPLLHSRLLLLLVLDMLTWSLSSPVLLQMTT
jgi:hypothetical protein